MVESDTEGRVAIQMRGSVPIKEKWISEIEEVRGCEISVEGDIMVVVSQVQSG